MLAIWRSVLRQEGLGVEDNFYDFGGSSLAAIQIATRANEAGLPLSAIDIFQNQTVAGVAALSPKTEPAKPAAKATVAAADKAKLAQMLKGAKRG